MCALDLVALQCVKVKLWSMLLVISVVFGSVLVSQAPAH